MCYTNNVWVVYSKREKANRHSCLPTVTQKEAARQPKHDACLRREKKKKKKKKKKKQTRKNKNQENKMRSLSSSDTTSPVFTQVH